MIPTHQHQQSVHVIHVQEKTTQEHDQDTKDDEEKNTTEFTGEECDHNNPEITWKLNGLDTRDLRPTIPVSNERLTSKITNRLPSQWKRHVEPLPFFFSRHLEEKTFRKSNLQVRCEEWSTLRQMLPSRGVAPRHGNKLDSSKMTR